jgi:membrane protein YdbS with pleckstrin-like domain
VSDLTESGIVAFITGKPAEAAQLFERSLIQNSRDIQTWFWLAAVSDTLPRRVECLRAVLEIDPRNAVARQAVNHLRAEGIPIRQAPTPPSSPPLVDPVRQPVPAYASTPVTYAPPGPAVSGNPERVLFVERLAVFPYLVLLGALIVFLLVQRNGMLHSDPFLAAVLLLPIWLMVLLVILFGLAWMTTRFTLTTQHLIVVRGILSRHRSVIPIRQIQGVSCHQDLFQRFWGTGDIHVDTAGPNSSVNMRSVARFRTCMEMILEASQGSLRD